MARQQVGLFDNIEGSLQDILDEYFPDVEEGVVGRIGIRTLTWIAEGKVQIGIQVQRERSEGKLVDVLLEVLKEGTFFGEIIAFNPDSRPSAYVHASQVCTLRYLRAPRQDRDETTPADVLRHLIDTEPQVAINMIAEMGGRLRRATRMIPVHPQGRVAGYLLQTADRKLSLSLDESKVDVLQEATGVAKSAISKKLNDMENARTINRNKDGTITIVDPSLLWEHFVL